MNKKNMLGNNGTDPHQRFFAFLSYFLFSKQQKAGAGKGAGVSAWRAAKS